MASVCEEENWELIGVLYVIVIAVQKKSNWEKNAVSIRETVLNSNSSSEVSLRSGLNVTSPIALQRSNGGSSSDLRRKSSIRNRKPDLKEMLKNSKEFELEAPAALGRNRSTSVRFDDIVSMAVEE